MEDNESPLFVTLKRLLLKKAFQAEMAMFLKDPSVRLRLSDAPVLFRAYRRASHSPLFHQDDMSTLEQLMDVLPKLQERVVQGTGRDLAGGITGAIANSWASQLTSETESKLPPVTVPMWSVESDVSMFFAEGGEWENASFKLDDGEEESEEDDIDMLSASLAQRRVRRVVFNSEMTKLVARVEQMGIAAFLEELEACESVEQTDAALQAALNAFFSLMRLTLLETMSKRRNRQKAKQMLSQMPSTAMSLLFRVANPIKLMHLGAKLSVKFRVPFAGGTMLQLMLRTMTAIDKTEKRLASLGRELNHETMSELKQLAKDLLRGGAVRAHSVALGHLWGSATAEQRHLYGRVVRLEMRRLEKQNLIDFGGGEEMRFVLASFFPILGRPILSVWMSGGSNTGGDIVSMQNWMSEMSSLIAAVEEGDSGEIAASMRRLETLVFVNIQAFLCGNGAVVELLFGWLFEAYRGGPESIDLERIVDASNNRDEVMREAKAMREHLERGGKSAALPTPHIDALCPEFRELLRAHVARTTPAATPVTTPVKSPAKKGFFFGRGPH